MNYKARNSIIAEMGYADYAAYLASPLWRSIRERVYAEKGRDCLRCKEPAYAVHHMDYGRDTLAGNDIQSLVPICKACHDAVHGKGVTRFQARIANRVLGARTRKMCASCRKNQAPKSRGVCRSCAKGKIGRPILVCVKCNKPHLEPHCPNCNLYAPRKCKCGRRATYGSEICSKCWKPPIAPTKRKGKKAGVYSLEGEPTRYVSASLLFRNKTP